MRRLQPNCDTCKCATSPEAAACNCTTSPEATACNSITCISPEAALMSPTFSGLRSRCTHPDTERRNERGANTHPLQHLFMICAPSSVSLPRPRELLTGLPLSQW